jgi:hypothetical protein
MSARASEPYRITAAALPGILAEIARLTTVEAAIAVARELGGKKFYTSTDPKRRHPLIRVLGWTAGRLVCNQLGGDMIEIPSAKAQLRKYDAVQLRLKGTSVRLIAAELGISISRAEQLVQGVPKGEAGAEVEVEDGRPGVAPPACPVCGHRHRQPRPANEDGRQMVLFDLPSTAPGNADHS